MQVKKAEKVGGAVKQEKKKTSVGKENLDENVDDPTPVPPPVKPAKAVKKLPQVQVLGSGDSQSYIILLNLYA